MASIERTDRGKWLARWRDPERKQCKRTFDRKVDAQRFLNEVEASKQCGQYVDPTDRTTVIEAARDWAAGRPHRPSTRQRIASSIEVHIAPSALANRRLSDVRPSEVQAWVSNRALVLAPSTLLQTYKIVRSVFHTAVADRRIGTTPCVRISLPRVDRPRLVPLAPAQVQRLAAAMPSRLGALVIVQAGLGLRLGEALALRDRDVNFLGRAVRVDQQVNQTRLRAQTKTPRSVRTVPLPAPVADALAVHMAHFGTGADGAIFTTAAGRYFRHEYVSRSLKDAVTAIGLPVDTTSHDLRHAYASTLIAQGESVITVAERLGHEDASLVLTTYGHLVQGHEDRTRRAIEDAWRALTVPTEDAMAL